MPYSGTTIWIYSPRIWGDVPIMPSSLQSMWKTTSQNNRPSALCRSMISQFTLRDFMDSQSLTPFRLSALQVFRERNEGGCTVLPLNPEWVIQTWSLNSFSFSSICLHIPAPLSAFIHVYHLPSFKLLCSFVVPKHIRPSCQARYQNQRVNIHQENEAERNDKET